MARKTAKKKNWADTSATATATANTAAAVSKLGLELQGQYAVVKISIPTQTFIPALLAQTGLIKRQPLQALEMQQTIKRPAGRPKKYARHDRVMTAGELVNQ